MVFEHTMTVAAPIEKVFALVDDAEQLKLWMDGLEEMVYTGPVDRDNPVGAEFRRKIREGAASRSMKAGSRHSRSRDTSR